MSSEYDREAAILESHRAGKSPKQINAWYDYQQDKVSSIAKTSK